MDEHTEQFPFSYIVIDDDPFILDVVRMNLESIGARDINCFDSGRQGLKLLDQGVYIDIILVDLQMPSMDGVEVLRNLAMRQFQGGILLFSGEDPRILKTAHHLARAHSLQVLGAITKPITAVALTNLLRNYHPRSNKKNQPHLELATPKQIQAALDQQQIIPFYQPQLSFNNYSLVSAEALARWQHPEQGMIPPIAFIPIAEESGLIKAITFSIFKQAIQQLGQWLKQGHKINLALNLSADCLEDIELPEKIAEMANTYNVPCKAITLEITETRLMQNITESLDVLTRFRLKEFGLSIDDFGTGYSSMSQLNKIPFTELKIDRAFVHNSAKDDAARAILESSAELAKKLDMTIVAEGIETLSDWQQCLHVGCDLAQGFFLSKPVDAMQFSQLLENNIDIPELNNLKYDKTSHLG
jgi:EAL domain-containing protein (putative c-di-GMP-specific phosphodiesterase class I)